MGIDMYSGHIMWHCMQLPLTIRIVPDMKCGSHCFNNYEAIRCDTAFLDAGKIKVYVMRTPATFTPRRCCSLRQEIIFLGGGLET